MKTFLFVLIIMVTSVDVIAQEHQHQSAASYVPVEASIILQQLMDDPGLENKEVKMLIVDFPPKSISKAHRHPCPTFGYVLEGEIESVFEGKTYVYKKGDSFYEKTNGLHHLARNNHAVQPAKLLVFFLADKGKPTSIPER